MFVWSLRSSKRELLIILIGIICFIISVCLLLFTSSGTKQSSAVLASGYQLAAKDAQGRQAFLAQFGWETEPEPVAVREIIIPDKLDDTYIKYNELQKEQGFDLEKYCGKRLKLWTYTVKNYPGIPSGVVANILTYGDIVVGGDISSTAIDGFMHGFDPSKYAQQTSAMQLEVQQIDRTIPDRIPEQSDIPPESDDDE